ncbi:hypothetical protein FI667_g13342, partial [Globisporangium splendens]
MIAGRLEVCSELSLERQVLFFLFVVLLLQSALLLRITVLIIYRRHRRKHPQQRLIVALAACLEHHMQRSWPHESPTFAPTGFALIARNTMGRESAHDLLHALGRAPTPMHTAVARRRHQQQPEAAPRGNVGRRHLPHLLLSFAQID